MSPFDTAHTTSYWRSSVGLCSCRSDWLVLIKFRLRPELWFSLWSQSEFLSKTI